MIEIAAYEWAVQWVDGYHMLEGLLNDVAPGWRLHSIQYDPSGGSGFSVVLYRPFAPENNSSTPPSTAPTAAP